MASKTRKAQPKEPTQVQAETIDTVAPLLSAVVHEMRELSKKKQDGILSKLKVDSINRLLGDVKTALGSDPSVRYLDLLEEDDLPQNSDAVLVLTQWEASVKQFREKHQGYDEYHNWVWFLGDGNELETNRHV
jgi:hypothetical protein